MNLLNLLPELDKYEIAVIGTGYHYFKEKDKPNFGPPFCPSHEYFNKNPMIVGLYDAEIALQAMERWCEYAHIVDKTILPIIMGKLRRYVDTQLKQVSHEHAASSTPAET